MICLIPLFYFMLFYFQCCTIPFTIVLHQFVNFFLEFGEIIVGIFFGLIKNVLLNKEATIVEYSDPVNVVRCIFYEQICYILGGTYICM